MHCFDHWRPFLALAVALIVAGAVRSAWATRRDGFTIDEPWHVTAGVAYLMTGEFYLNPEHPPLVKLIAGFAARRAGFHFTEPSSLHDKTDERKFVQEAMYVRNDADSIQSRVRPYLYAFNGLLLLCFALAAFRVFGGAVALGALSFALIDPTIAAHWPVVMTDLPVALLSSTSVLLLIDLLRKWAWGKLALLSMALGLTLSIKHSGLITFGFVAAMGLAAVIWQFRDEKRVALRRTFTFPLVLAGAVVILWGMYGFHYRESKDSAERFNRTLVQKIGDIRSPIWRMALNGSARWRLLPRAYVWGLADIVRTGMEGRAHSDYAFGRLTFMEPRPLLFPGYVAVKIPIPLLLLAAFGTVVAFGRRKTKLGKVATGILLLLAVTFLLVLARSGAGYAGVRHALVAYFPLAILAGVAFDFLASFRRKLAGLGALGLAMAGCFPALVVERPWEYHNVLGGGTLRAYLYFRNDSVDLGQRDKEIADYCRRKLEPSGEVPWLVYYPSFIEPDLRIYRRLKVNALADPKATDLPPIEVSGTILIDSQWTAPTMWSQTALTKYSDYSALRDVQPVERMGNVLVFRGKYYLPAARADALFNRADELLAGANPELAKVEDILKEGLALRPNDFVGWMSLGNIYLRRQQREQALAAYQKAMNTAPPSPLRGLFDEQIRRVSTDPLDTVPPMRDPGIE
jgi:hypothetical protein